MLVYPAEDFIHISYDSDSEKTHVTASILWQQGESIIPNM